MSKYVHPHFESDLIENDLFHPGLTKREYFAIRVMQSLIMRDSIQTTESISKKAIAFADALIKELSKEEGVKDEI